MPKIGTQHPKTPKNYAEMRAIETSTSDWQHSGVLRCAESTPRGRLGRYDSPGGALSAVGGKLASRRGQLGRYDLPGGALSAVGGKLASRRGQLGRYDSPGGALSAVGGKLAAQRVPPCSPF
jgi:hypothetical protein